MPFGSSRTDRFCLTGATMPRFLLLPLLLVSLFLPSPLCGQHHNHHHSHLDTDPDMELRPARPMTTRSTIRDWIHLPTVPSFPDHGELSLDDNNYDDSYDYNTQWPGSGNAGTESQSSVVTTEEDDEYVDTFGPPDQVHNCSITDYTSDSLRIECEPGYDGGLQQKFYLEVYNAALEYLEKNLTRIEPSFYVQDVPPSTEYLLVIYVANMKGRSPSVVIRGFTAPRSEQEGHRDHFRNGSSAVIVAWFLFFLPLISTALLLS